ncbi:MAG TPA: uracil-DNA glycosylase [Gammaproteobacteria bacterium]|nr:uracil-DNA glycosylase [Gammaproteobacteria bacterium]
MTDSAHFDSDCCSCPRLAGFLAEVRVEYPTYHARPVEPFGDPAPRLLIVGLAPGMHGANATGRPFTGDHAGILLYETLHRFGYSNQPVATARDDGLVLKGCRITNAVKCLPPQNKPVGSEVNECNRYLYAELTDLDDGAVILALGSVAHRAAVRALGLKMKEYPFGHCRKYPLDRQRWLIDSYHCSRYNTQTRRLTEKMFHDVFREIEKLLAA